MVLAPSLHLRQTQSLVMTPQLQQAIKLLQLSNIELTAYVEQELERNPLLERAEPRDVAGAGEDRYDDRRDAGEGVLIDSPDGRAGSEAPLDVEIDNSYDAQEYESGPAAPEGVAAAGAEGFADDWSSVGSGGRRDFMDDDGGYENTLAGGVSLRDHLVDQLACDVPEGADRLIGQAFIDSLDDNGYLTVTVEEMAETMGAPVERVRRVLDRLQRFDPPGLFARDLAECLALQLREKDRLDPCMQALLANLDLLAKRDVPQLLKVCGVDAEDLAEMVAEIRACDPRPALRFTDVPAQPVVPDVLMRPAPDGGWHVELNTEALPRVLVNHRYYALVSKAARSKEDKGFVAENFQTASWLVKALDQRANTILKVAVEIVRQQDAFFVHGISALRPLILRDIATAIEMHESTVSRVTSNKYIATPRGIFELKYFFTQAIAGADGEAHSAEAVRHRIRALIDAESADDVLSDDTLVALLKKEGIDIARRTVAKYREGMKIASSVQRRREKRMKLTQA
ncbi:MAG: RNA polymerase factor sigma-54 [Caenispirillum bisanense]|nr:RNA polymerase factor sigma-54 [Caenispirillum bisanense]MCA1973793.1 RNA polymerase factor sigma-54 [Caenispirillum sp.]